MDRAFCSRLEGLGFDSQCWPCVDVSGKLHIPHYLCPPSKGGEGAAPFFRCPGLISIHFQIKTIEDFSNYFQVVCKYTLFLEYWFRTFLRCSAISVLIRALAHRRHYFVVLFVHTYIPTYTYPHAITSPV